MITLPATITVEDFQTYLTNLYPPHNIAVLDGEGDPDEALTDALHNTLLYTAYYELYLTFDLDAAPFDSVVTAVHHHAVHIWRSEGARSARLDLISQTVAQAGIVKETYDRSALPFSPIINTLLQGYKRVVALKLVQRVRPMDHDPNWEFNQGI